jgi:hypothetical protein
MSLKLRRNQHKVEFIKNLQTRLGLKPTRATIGTNKRQKKKKKIRENIKGISGRQQLACQKQGIYSLKNSLVVSSGSSWGGESCQVLVMNWQRAWGRHSL